VSPYGLKVSVREFPLAFERKCRSLLVATIGQRNRTVWSEQCIHEKGHEGAHESKSDHGWRLTWTDEVPAEKATVTA
jgi:hypothetical protein